MAERIPQRAAVVGLGSMGMGMARRLVGAGFEVAGYDVRGDAVEALAAAGGKAAGSPAEAARGAGLLLLVVVNAAQAEEALFGDAGAAPHLPEGAVVMLSSTVPPSFVRAIAEPLAAAGLLLLDAPISGGFKAAEEGR